MGATLSNAPIRSSAVKSRFCLILPVGRRSRKDSKAIVVIEKLSLTPMPELSDSESRARGVRAVQPAIFALPPQSGAWQTARGWIEHPFIRIERRSGKAVRCHFQIAGR